MSDVLVLGGGTAGAVLAARLSEDPHSSVCLVEGGPDYGAQADGHWPDDLLDARQGPDSHDWRDSEGTLTVARVLGGCSAHNLCFWIHPADADWDEWAAATGDAGWSAAAMREHVARVEDTMPLRHFTPAELNPWLRSCIAAADEIGLGALADVNDHRAVTGAGPMPVNCVGTTRVNAAFAYLDPARGRHNLTIVADALVDRVTFEAGRATGAIVRVAGREGQLRADTVLLAAGSYGSPAVLMRSGIGPADELDRHGIEAVADLPVGRRLRDHCSVPLRLAPSAAMQAAIDAHAATGLTFFSQGIAWARSAAAPDALWDLHLMIGLVPAAAGGFPDRTGHLLGLNAALVKPAWEGSVTLASADPERLPLVTPQTLDAERDRAAIEDGLDLCLQLAGSEAARGGWVERLVPEPDAALPEFCAGSVRPYFHPVGTCALGPVLDAGARVRGFENLRVADASIMPSIPRANTNLAVLAAAERVAAML